MPLNNSDAADTDKRSDTEYVEGGIAPLYVSLSRSAPLPSEDYVRVVALSGAGDVNSDAPCVQKNARTDVNWKNGCCIQNLTESEGKEPVRHDFALHLRGARNCRLLDTMLDAYDLHMGAIDRDALDDIAENKAERTGKDAVGHLPPVVLPQATYKGCKALFLYLDMITTRVPTTISKPLRAPIEELLQPWEMNFLLKDCMDETTSRAISQQMNNGKDGKTKSRKSVGDTRTAYYSVIVNNAPDSLNLITELAMLSDFLIVEPLRQLTCAFLASLALGASSEAELLRLCGLSRPLTEEELDPVYAQFPFLRPDTVSEL
ncbi:hypothetical protein MOQ_004827 [Trypanosoma cruzi marinkellei]|uniref:Uncharacterized protein n=2 Tax=Trypanosoma cruzi marinkellei TaxID=85056 RepID=K2MW35_TRYCR|nr:hypothetical protein MOQ_004827 [Trypanosoma cruzi marinkellei]